MPALLGRPASGAAPQRSGAYRVFTRERVFLVKSSETSSVRPSARASIRERTVEELRERPQELVASILQGDPRAVTCRENPQLSRATRSQSSWRLRVSMIQSSINIDRITTCVAVVGQLHGLLTVGRLSMPTAYVVGRAQRDSLVPHGGHNGDTI